MSSFSPPPPRSWSGSPVPDAYERRSTQQQQQQQQSDAPSTVLNRRRQQIRGWVRSLRRSDGLLQKLLAVLLTWVLVLISSRPPTPPPRAEKPRASSDGAAAFRRSSHVPRHAAASASASPPPPPADLNSASIPSASALTYYELLLLSPSASASEVKAAFRKLALRLHPDKLSAMSSSIQGMPSSASSPHLPMAMALDRGSSGGVSTHPLLQLRPPRALSIAEAQSVFCAIQEAYECLRNPLERKRYDAALRRGVPYKKLPVVTVDDTAHLSVPSTPQWATPLAWQPSVASTAPGTATNSRCATRRNSNASFTAGATPAADSAAAFANGWDATAFASGASARPSRRSSVLKPAVRALFLPVAFFWAAAEVLVWQPLSMARDAVSRCLPSPTGLLYSVSLVLVVSVYVLLYVPLQLYLLARAIKKLVRHGVRTLVMGVMGASAEEAATSPYTSAAAAAAARRMQIQQKQQTQQQQKEDDNEQQEYVTFTLHVPQTVSSTAPPASPLFCYDSSDSSPCLPARRIPLSQRSGFASRHGISIPHAGTSSTSPSSDNSSRSSSGGSASPTSATVSAAVSLSTSSSMPSMAAAVETAAAE